ncbi:MAG: NAD(P)H-quinone oxidoreductase, partial [Deltaproteobacteria bacterium]|nr:NAD(P)H-quinone oxidoreductase [Deltaproteobacteria bacterium]
MLNAPRNIEEFDLIDKCKVILVDSTQNNALKIALISVPSPGNGEVLIRVEAAGVNHADLYQRQGNYPPPKGASSILGVEVAGTVAKLGSDVTSLQVGDKVMALVSGGGYAEYCVAPQETVISIPPSLTFSEAAAVPEAYFTIWSNVFEMAELKKGETLLVHGGTSGIGSTTIQLAKIFGATVIATARTPEKCSACLQLGADYAINYSETQFSEEVQKLTRGNGVDIIFDWIGERYFDKHIALLRRKGRLVLIDCSSGHWGKLNLGRLIDQNLKVIGSVLRRRPFSEKVEIAKQV